ncbi:thermonuclease family protein [Methylogaea oryzae]|uniref:thermonuclease family protein n=1 Tax=Methylogaea oryzae TaxID=1295382 RepID=UPI001C3F1F2F|nr:thermonuclease family protein [Methylogaea oryzae]
MRLADIDAPEKAQSFGNQSKMSLSGLCFGKQAQVETMTMDRYGRTVGRVRCDGVDANAEQIRRGMAWAYRQYLTDQSLLTMETEAKSARRGLWGDSDPVPPWDYRHGGKPSTANTAPGSDPNQYHLGPRGGCYTITNGETHYVSHSKCR